jgi:DNA mismatch repair protein MutS
MPVKEAGEEIVFLRKVLPGSVDRSYGIQVARLAGLPRKVTDRAAHVLGSLEAQNPPGRVSPRGKVYAQATLFQAEALPHPVLEEIGKLDLMNMTPVQALNALHELQKRLGAGREAKAINNEEGR